MSRIQKIVERGKAELNKNNTSRVDEFLEQRAAAQAAPNGFEYSTTKRVNVPREALLKQRLVAVEEGDPRAARFQILRTRVLQQMRKKGWTSLGISAPGSGAGKSLIAANLAVSIAMEGNQSVLLVDMDLRKPSIHKYFGLDPEYGMQDLLEGSARVEDTLINPGIERLVLLPGRKGILNSAAKISAPFVKGLVDELKTRYESRIVIFDLPPALVSDDVMVFMPYIDCSLCVIESGKSTKKDAQLAIEILGAKPLLGTVLNKSDSSLGELAY